MTYIESSSVYQRSNDGVWVLTAKHGEMVETIELYKYVGHPVTNADVANEAAGQWLANYEQISTEASKQALAENELTSTPQERQAEEQPQGEEDMAETAKKETAKKPRSRVRTKTPAKKTPAKRSTAKKAPAKKSTRKMSDEHKQALADGRSQARVVNAYMAALDANKPKRGRRRTADVVQSQLDKIEVELKNGVGGVTQLSLVQQRRDLTVELAGLVGNGGPSVEEAQAEFVKVAKAYGKTRGISYGAWREVGVPAEVLKAAGITRGKSE